MARKFPAAIDRPSATRLAAPIINTALCGNAPPATPATTANVVMMPSFAPYTEIPDIVPRHRDQIAGFYVNRRPRHPVETYRL